MPSFRDDSTARISDALGQVPSGSPMSEVARRLMEIFVAGTVEAGTRLPPERQLAQSLGVGRSAIREALAALEILGIVDVRPGSGTYLRGSASDLLPDTLRWGLMIGRENTEQLLELRSGLETFVARLAAQRADDDQKARMDASLELMASAGHDMAQFARADADFHDVLGRAAANDTLTDQLQVVRSLLQVYADRAVHSVAHAQNALREHRLVAEAIRAGDPDAAASAMAAHMTTATARLLEATPS